MRPHAAPPFARPAEPAPPIIGFRGVQKTYDGKHYVVRDLDLDIVRGEFLTLLGPSGSGKTTSLMMLAGFEAPSAGVISIDGLAVQDVPPHRRGLGVVFQNYALFPHMTVAENIGYPLKIRGAGKREIAQQVGASLELVRLGGLGHRRPAQLSGGQQQRVALARALAFRPKILLMDEPLGALDRKLREQLQAEIKRIHTELGVTLVYVTHDQDEALTMSSRIAVFENGAIRQVDTPEGIYERPASSFVANFIGENNHLHGIVRAQDGDIGVVQLDSGERVTARLGPTVRPGERTTVCVRPEKVRLGSSTAGSNEFDARVLEQVYLGSQVRLRVSVAGSDDFHLRLDASRAASINSVIKLSWAASDAWALDPMPRTGD